jgi:hypothetical protein
MLWIYWRRKKRTRIFQNSGYQPGAAAVAAVISGPLRRRSKIFAEQTRSVADDLMDNSINSVGEEEGLASRLER